MSTFCNSFGFRFFFVVVVVVVVFVKNESNYLTLKEHVRIMLVACYLCICFIVVFSSFFSLVVCCY